MSEQITLASSHSPTALDKEALVKKLSAFNRSRVPGLQKSTEAVPCFVSAKSVDGTLVGAISGRCLWNALHIDFFWVDDQYRGQGIGQQLLDECEQLAIKQSCALSYVETFSWQAKPFYERHGYKLVGTIEDMPKGHATHILFKHFNP